MAGYVVRHELWLKCIRKTEGQICYPQPGSAVLPGMGEPNKCIIALALYNSTSTDQKNFVYLFISVSVILEPSNGKGHTN